MSEPALHEPLEEYDGPATVLLESTEIPVEVRLRGHFEPIDGKFHWYGRIAADPVLTERNPSGATIQLRTPHGTATGRLSDVDPWGRFRVAGTGRPPL